MSERLSAELWQSVSDIYAAILVHPFLRGLTDGSLPSEVFTFYVIQDALYLRKYAQALAEVATRAADPAGTEMFARHAASVVAVEMSLHDSLLADLDIDPAAVDLAQEAPTTLAYNSYLLACVRGGSYAEGVGTVLPCYWIYQEVGRHLAGQGSPDPRYRRWVGNHGGEEEEGEGRGGIAGSDEVGARVCPVSFKHLKRPTSRRV